MHVFLFFSSRDDWMIRVRVCRMWDAINTKRDGELISLDMIFMDEKETLIHAIIRKNQVNRFRHLLVEGSLFVIKNFKVVEPSGEYRPVTSNIKIHFLLTTSIKKLQEDSVNIPINGFEFVKAEMLDARLNNNRILSDVVGCLCGIGDMESAGAKWKKRDIQVITDYMVKSKITLWEDFGEKFDPYLYSKDSGPYIVIVTSCTVKEFHGEVCFATTSASKIYVNLDIEYITSLTPKFATTSVGLQTLESSNAKIIPPEEEMFLNRMNIKELLEYDWSPEIQEYILTVRAKITEIDNFFKWYYISCNKCPKKVKPSNGVYICDGCAKVIEYPLVKYKIIIKVTDDTKKKTTFVLFNPVAEKLLDTSAKKLFNRLPASSDEVPVQILSLCQKEFIFKLKLNNYNLIEGVEDFTVSKVFIPDENLEAQYKITKENKGKSKLEVEVHSESRKQNPKRRISKGLKTDQGPVDVSLDSLKDSEVVENAEDGVKSRKRKNVIIDDEDVSEDDK